MRALCSPPSAVKELIRLSKEFTLLGVDPRETNTKPTYSGEAEA